MPFIIEAERYEIVDYNAMLVYMMQFPIFESPNKRLEYFSRWINHLKAIDDEMANARLVVESLECFSFPISFDAVHVRIQFNIDAISKLVKDKQAVAAPLKAFGPERGQINYTPVADGEFDRVTEPPTILVAAIRNDPGRKGVVIDGNHRLAGAMASDLESVNVKYLGDPFLSRHPEAFVTTWDHALYTFINETMVIYRCMEIGWLNDEQAIARSYLSGDVGYKF